MIKKKTTFELIYFLIFFISIANAVSGYIQSSYLKQFMSLSTMGLFLAFIAIIILLLAIIHPKAIIKYSNYELSIFLMILIAVSSVLLSFSTNIYLVLTSFVVRYISLIFLFLSFDIFLENISINSKTGRIRTTYMTAINLAWIFAAIIMGYLVGENNNYSNVFLISSVIFIFMFFVMLSQKKKLLAHIKYPKYDPIESIKKIKKDKNLVGIFNSSLTLNIFYAFATLYIPIYLNHTIGIPWQTLGIMFAVMLIPFILFEIPAGYLADKYIGEKEMLLLSNLILIVAMILMFITDTTNPVVWGAILFFSRIGAALAESMQESYFYKKIGAKDVDLINIFRQSNTIGYLLAALIAFALLMFVGIKYLFIFMIIIFAMNLVNISVIKDTK